MKPILKTFVFIGFLTTGFLFCDANKEQITQIDNSIENLVKWQNKYKKKQKSLEASSQRVLFRNSTEARKLKLQAQDAKENASVLQDEIDTLAQKRQRLLNL